VIEESAAGALHHAIEPPSVDVNDDARLTTDPYISRPREDTSSEGGAASQRSDALGAELITRERVCFEVHHDEYHCVLVVL
jgi:hypothetical protein